MYKSLHKTKSDAILSIHLEFMLGCKVIDKKCTADMYMHTIIDHDIFESVVSSAHRILHSQHNGVVPSCVVGVSDGRHVPSCSSIPKVPRVENISSEVSAILCGE